MYKAYIISNKWTSRCDIYHIFKFEIIHCVASMSSNRKY